jgi:hypothetical protein
VLDRAGTILVGTCSGHEGMYPIYLDCMTI